MRSSCGTLALLLAFALTASEPADARAQGPLEIEQIVVERRNDRDRVVAELNRPASFRVLPGSEGPARLEIAGARVGAQAARHLEGDAASAIKRVDVEERG